MSGNELKMSDDQIIVTKTDKIGKIVYGNRTFFEFAGYSKKEVLGVQHNIVRHPEMPRAVFKLLWDTIQSGEEIFAYVNNRAKNGDSYWVFAHVTPSFGPNGEINGYHSNRRAPNRTVLDEKINPTYAELLRIEKSVSSPKEGLENSMDHLHTLLKKSGMGFNELMFSWGV